MMKLIFVEDSPQSDSPEFFETALSTMKIPRPLNKWMLYKRDKYEEIKQGIISIPNVRISEINAFIAEMYNNETEEVSNRYSRLAEEEKLRHKNMYPNYKFTPQQREKKTKTSPQQIQEAIISTQQIANELLPSISNDFSEEYNGQTIGVPSETDAGLHYADEFYGENRWNLGTYGGTIEEYDYSTNFDLMGLLRATTPPSEFAGDLELPPGGLEMDFVSSNNNDILHLNSYHYINSPIY